MSIFDVYLSKLSQYLEEMGGKGRQVSETGCPTEVNELTEGLPVKVGPGASSGLILRSDTFLELGNPEAGSCAFLLWTDNPSLVRDGKITLIGPDIQESAGASLPFGQVLMVGGADINEEVHEVLEHTQFVADQIEGYMIRGASQHIWSRVSRGAAEKGFCFEILGRALMAIFKSQIPQVQSMEILFVTSAKEDLHPLDGIERQVQKIAKDIVTKNWKARGIDLAECTFGWDCNSCPDKEVCDDIRELITIRKTRASNMETT
jgi:acetyl-CoA synthase